MLRPVGSRVPDPEPAEELHLPWQPNYQTWFMGSGTQALSVAVMMAISIHGQNNSRPEVVLPAYGCPDLVAAIVKQGAVPVLVDMLPGHPFMDENKLSAALTKSTVAVIAVGFLGLPERLSLIADVCSQRRILLIEDSAQCFPPDCTREPIADFAVLSFGRGKPINLMGGGALLVRNEHVALALKVLSCFREEQWQANWQWKLRRHIFNLLLQRFAYGLIKRIPFLGIGATVFKPVASLSKVKLPKGLLEAGIRAAAQRPSLAMKYNSKLGFLESRGWTLFMDRDVPESAWLGQVTLRYGLLAPDQQERDKALDLLNKQGIGANSFYGKSLPAIAGLPDILAVSAEEYPEAKAFADRLITLPSHEDVYDEDISVIARVLDQPQSKATNNQ